MPITRPRTSPPCGGRSVETCAQASAENVKLQVDPSTDAARNDDRKNEPAPLTAMLIFLPLAYASCGDSHEGFPNRLPHCGPLLCWRPICRHLTRPPRLLPDHAKH